MRVLPLPPDELGFFAAALETDFAGVDLDKEATMLDKSVRGARLAPRCDVSLYAQRHRDRTRVLKWSAARLSASEFSARPVNTPGGVREVCLNRRSGPAPIIG